MRRVHPPLWVHETSHEDLDIRSGGVRSDLDANQAFPSVGRSTAFGVGPTEDAPANRSAVRSGSALHGSAPDARRSSDASAACSVSSGQTANPSCRSPDVVAVGVGVIDDGAPVVRPLPRDGAGVHVEFDAYH